MKKRVSFFLILKFRPKVDDDYVACDDEEGDVPLYLPPGLLSPSLMILHPPWLQMSLSRVQFHQYQILRW